MKSLTRNVLGRAPAKVMKATPDCISIKPTRMNFSFGNNVPHYWLDNDPFSTHFLSVLSTFFPDGERFFVDSVRALRDKVDDKKRQKAISGFIGQEAMHSLEHTAMNDLLEERGLPANKATNTALAMLNFGRRWFGKRQQLAGTVALEHFTAILAHRLLSDPELIEQMHETMRPIWLWHAIEETEHKAVAWDLYHDIKGHNYVERVAIMIFASTLLAIATAINQIRFMRADQQLWNFRSWFHGLNKLFGRRGIITGLTSDYLDFFKPGFHPWDHENSALVAYWRDQLEQAIKEAA